MSHELTIVPDSAALAAAAAELIEQIAAARIAARGQFTLVLAGGHTPEQTYQLLTKSTGPGRLDWSNTFFFFGDERCVPHDDPRSNFAMARRALFAQAPVPDDNIWPIETNLAMPTACAAAYGERLAAFFGAASGGPPPAFDLVLLGLGDDGHTASLFPGAPALGENVAWVTSSPPGVLPPPVDRVTMTFPLLNAARHVLFLVSGAGKAPALRDVLEGNANKNERPAAGIRPAAGKLTWLVDEAAAGELKNRR